MAVTSKDDVDVEVGTTLDLIPSEGAAALDRASIDIQVATAKQYPRSITKALREAKELATMDAETAGSCFYVLPRGGKDIQGPSARLAEIMVYSWGNMRAEADIVSEDKRFITAMGTAFDLEKNVAVRVRVKRRITDNKGKKFSDDMIGVTSNAAVSIAFRNAVFKCIPRSYTQRIYKYAQLASTGKGTMEAKRTKAVDFFVTAGVKPEQVYALLGVKGLDDIGVDELIRLVGIATAVKEGETTLHQVFDPPKSSEAATELDEALAAKEGPTKEEAALLKEAREKCVAKLDELGERVELGEREKVDELHAAGDLGALIKLDQQLGKRLQATNTKEG